MSILRRHRATFIALLGSTMLSVSPVFAQEAADDAASDDIIVTAQKRSESLQKVPLSIQAIGTEKLDQLQVNDFQDTVKFLPSVTIQQGAPGFAQVYFRGVASGENANHSSSLPTVGVYLDEQPITTIQGALDLHVYDIARVEALAGPQGTLYGASSMAGTLKLVTNKPDPSKFYGELGLEGNTVAHGSQGGVAEGFVNAPLADNIAVRAVGWYRKDGGYIDNVAGSRTYPTSGITQSNAALVKKDYNDTETYGGRIALGIELDDSWTIRPSLMAQKQTANGSFGQERGRAKNLETVQYNPEGSSDKWYQAGMTIEGKLGNLDLTYAGGYLRRKGTSLSDYSDYAYFYDALSGYGAYFTDNGGTLVSPNQYIQAKDSYRKYFSEFRIATPSDKTISLIAGAFWQRQAHNIEQNYIIDNIADAITVPGTASNIWLTKQLRTDRDIAGFGEVTLKVTDQFKLTGGLRVYNYKNSLVGFFGYSEGFNGDKTDPVGLPDVIVQDGTGVAECGILSGPVRPAIVAGSPCTNVQKTTSDTDMIHKLNAVYEIDEDKLIYMTWSRGFRPGGINRRGTLPPYRPDALKNYEIGWKTSWGGFRWNGAIYHLAWDDIQLSFLGANGLTEIRNAGKARVRGIETDVNFRSGGMTLSAGGSYNKSTITRDFCAIANSSFDCSIPGPDSRTDDDLLPDLNETLAPAGTRLPVTPKFKGNAVVRYEMPVFGGNWDGHIQLAGNYTSARRSDLRTTQQAIKGPLASYSTVDFSLGIKNDAWSGEFFVTNLLDSNGVINTGVQCRETVCGTGVTAATPTGGVFYDTVVRPRIIGIKATRRF